MCMFNREKSNMRNRREGKFSTWYPYNYISVRKIFISILCHLNSILCLVILRTTWDSLVQFAWYQISLCSVNSLSSKISFLLRISMCCKWTFIQLCCAVNVGFLRQTFNVRKQQIWASNLTKLTLTFLNLMYFKYLGNMRIILLMFRKLYFLALVVN